MDESGHPDSVITDKPFIWNISYIGKPTAGTPIFMMKIPTGMTFIISEDFLGATGICGTLPTAQADFSFTIDGTSSGTISFDTDGSLILDCDEVEITEGQVVRLFPPDPQDATLENFSISIYGKRS